MTAALYIRVSTSMQTEKESLQTQEERLKAYCKANNIPNYIIYKDAGISAKDIKRPALEKLMQDIEAGKIQAVIVTKLDRITRSLKDLIHLMEFFEKHNVKFISITQNIDTTGPMGRFMLNLLGSVAQVEREMTAERVGEDLLHRALAGKWNGGPIPYGYITRSKLLENLKKQGYSEEERIKKANEIAPEPKKLYVYEEEAKVVRKIFNMYLEIKSIRGVTEKLNIEGYRTRNKLPWVATSVFNILRNPTYTGRIWYGKHKTNLITGKLNKMPEKEWKIVKGEQERIIDDEVFYKVQELLKNRSFAIKKSNTSFLLSGLLKCGQCNGYMYGVNYRKKYTSKLTKNTKIKDYVWYRCSNYTAKGKAICKGMRIPARQIEEIIINEIKKVSQNKEFLKDKEKLLTIVKKKLKPSQKSYNEILKKLETEATKLQNRIDTLLEMRENKEIDNITFKNEYNKLKGLLENNLKRQLEIKNLCNNADTNVSALEFSLSEIENFSKNWDFLDIEGKKARLHAIVKEIIIKDNKIDIVLFIDMPIEISNMFSKEISSDSSSGGSGKSGVLKNLGALSNNFNSIDIGRFKFVNYVYQRNPPFLSQQVQD